MKREDPHSSPEAGANGPIDDDATLDSIREHLVAYLDGELDEPLRSRVAERLERDHALAEEARDPREAWRLLDADDVPPVPEGFVANVVARTTSSPATSAAPPASPASPASPAPARRFPGPAARVGLLLAAGVLVAIGLGILVPRLGGKDGPPEPGAPDGSGSLVADVDAALDAVVEDPRDLEVVADLELLEALAEDVEFLALLETSDDGSVEVSVW